MNERIRELEGKIVAVCLTCPHAKKWILSLDKIKRFVKRRSTNAKRKITS